MKPSLLPTLSEHEELDDAKVPLPRPADALLDISDLVLGEEIGRGGFSHVYRGTFKGAEVAIKKMPLADKDAVKYLNSELAILKSCKHPHLIQYHGAALRGKEVFIVTEFMSGGDLSTILSKHVDVPLPWRLRCRMARDAIEGLVSLHENECVHRDVKTENFLVDESWRVVVADYGFARKATSNVAMTICGTDEFMAPEVIFGEVYDEKADVFSFGVFLAELICRRVPGGPFLAREPRTKFMLDVDAFRAAAPRDAPPSLVELAAQCCCYEAEYRMSSEDAFEWLSALTEELDAAAGSDPTPMPPPPSEMRKRPAVRFGDVGAAAGAGSAGGGSGSAADGGAALVEATGLEDAEAAADGEAAEAAAAASGVSAAAAAEGTAQGGAGAMP